MRCANARYTDNETPVFGVIKADDETESDNIYWRDYARYWHGYLILLRPLLTVFDLKELRFLNQALQQLLIAGLCVLLYRRRRSLYIVPVLAAWLLMIPSAVAMSMQFSDMFYLGFGGLAVILWQGERLRGTDALPLLFMLFGILTAFFDLLTVPLLSLLLPACGLLMLNRQGSLRQYIAELFPCAVCWAAGFVLMWGMKWVLASVVLHQDVIGDALREIGICTADADGTGTAFTWKDVFSRNLRGIRDNISVPVISALYLIGCTVTAIRRGGIAQKGLPCALTAACVACAPFLWYLVASAHSYAHSYFTYRLTAATVMAALCAAAAFVPCDGPQLSADATASP